MTKVTHAIGSPCGYTKCGIKSKADKSVRIASINQTPTCKRCLVAKKSKRSVVNFVRFGPIETSSFRITQGWIEITERGTELYPPITKKGCYAIATGRGAKAVFHEKKEDIKS